MGGGCGVCGWFGLTGGAGDAGSVAAYTEEMVGNSTAVVTDRASRAARNTRVNFLFIRCPSFRFLFSIQRLVLALSLL